MKNFFQRFWENFLTKIFFKVSGKKVFKVNKIMYSIHDREDLEKIKKLQSITKTLKNERLKERLGKQDFHYDLKEVFEPVTDNQDKQSKQLHKNIEKCNKKYKRFKQRI